MQVQAEIRNTTAVATLQGAVASHPLTLEALVRRARQARSRLRTLTQLVRTRVRGEVATFRMRGPLRGGTEVTAEYTGRGGGRDEARGSFGSPGMSQARLAYLALLAIMVIDYALLVTWGGARLGAQSAGLAPFDLRVTGYGLEDAKTYLAALTPAGTALYLGTIRFLDTVFPVTCTLALGIAIWHRGRGLAVWLRGGLSLLAPLYGALDLLENAATAGLLRAGPEAVTAADVARASMLTQAKFGVFGLAIAALLALLIRRQPGAKV
jgi:hypothetical protein